MSFYEIAMSFVYVSSSLADFIFIFLFFGLHSTGAGSIEISWQE